MTAGIRVIDYINRADPARAVAAYTEAYGPERDGLALFERYKEILNACVKVQTEMAVLLTDFGGDVDVSGRARGQDNWGLSFTDWNEWALMPVINETGRPLTGDEIAAHLYYEMTWHGFPEQIVERRDEVMDLAEKVRRHILGKKESS